MSVIVLAFSEQQALRTEAAMAAREDAAQVIRDEERILFKDEAELAKVLEGADPTTCTAEADHYAAILVDRIRDRRERLAQFREDVGL